MMRDAIKVVLMAGGKGTRLWPKSRQSTPKQFVSLRGRLTLFQRSLERALKVTPMENIYVVTQSEYVTHIHLQSPDFPSDQIIVEPCQHSTTAALGYLLEWFEHRQLAKDDVLIILPTDIEINSDANFQECLDRAADLAVKTDGIVTIGVPPTHPATRYGYIKTCEGSFEDECRVCAFYEKPDINKAKEYILNQRFFWNSGIFVWKIATVWELFLRYQPDSYQQLEILHMNWGSMDEVELRNWHRQFPEKSFEYTIVEKAADIYMVPANFQWTDLGTWSIFIQNMDEENDAKEKQVYMEDASGCLVENEGGLVAIFGADDLIVVNTKDVVFICHRDREEEMKSFLENLKGSEYHGYL